MILESAALGLLGGIARACVGLLKAMRNDVEIVWTYTAVTIVASGIIGAAAGSIFNSDAKISVIAGYIGTDLLENTYKIIFKKKQL
ncbi:MAG: hypothetical protein Q8R18_01250 [bacterium]|nr:hypothetical protein [bacterium]